MEEETKKGDTRIMKYGGQQHSVKSAGIWSRIEAEKRLLDDN